jgi:hypothetical protein
MANLDRLITTVFRRSYSDFALLFEAAFEIVAVFRAGKGAIRIPPSFSRTPG